VDPETAGDFTELFGRIAPFAAQPGADYVKGEVDRKWFERIPYFMDPEEGPPTPWAPFTQFERVKLAHPFRWSRQTILVKDDTPNGHAYLVVADDLSGNRELEPAFNFWCMAKEVTQDGRHLHLTGQYGVDLDMFILEPAAGRIQTGEYSADKLETQKLVRVFGKPDGTGFRVVLYPRKPEEPKPKVESLANGKLTKVTRPDQTHWILLSKEPAAVADGPVSARGTAAVVKRWANGRSQLTLLEAGSISHAGQTLSGERSATATADR